jgi:glyoxylase-like metal-dependent hydrolase (beta-lactamase superfamily II)
MNPNQLKLHEKEVGPWPMNAYVLVCPTTNESMLIDPGADPESLMQMLGDSTPVAILITHSHIDHISELDEMRNRLGVPVMSYQGPHSGGVSLSADRHLADGDMVVVGNHTLRVYHAPGHIDDQICFALEQDHRVIVGDTIFEGGPGKTWSADGFRTTLNTLHNVVLPWPDDTVCYPGHGPSFRLGDKRASIEAFLAKDHRDFFGDATWDM